MSLICSRTRPPSCAAWRDLSACVRAADSASEEQRKLRCRIMSSSDVLATLRKTDALGLPGVERVHDSSAAGGRRRRPGHENTFIPHAGMAAGNEWGGDCRGEEQQRRESLNSNASDEDWEVVQKRDSLSGSDAHAAACRSTGAMGLPGTVLARAGDWLQWGFDGAVKGVEKTCDGIKGVW